MRLRTFPKSGSVVSEVGLGCWQIGADWGHVSEADALRILETAVDSGITFFDTADVYGDGRSERLIGTFLREAAPDAMVATKVGRRNYPGPYSRAELRKHIQECSQRLGVDALDLVQLHCVPTETLRDGSIFDWLREFRAEGLVKGFGASVETMDEAMSIVSQPELASLQIIFNIFRQKAIATLFDAAAAAQVALIIRLPLASGLLAGKFTKSTSFDESDHRNYNRDGAAFNVGETFAGLALADGARLAEEVRPFVPDHLTMAQFAQRWILDHPAVTTMITGASSPTQVRENAGVADLAPLEEQIHQDLAAFYRSRVLSHIRGPY